MTKLPESRLKEIEELTGCLIPNDGVAAPSCHERTYCDCVTKELLSHISAITKERDKWQLNYDSLHESREKLREQVGKYSEDYNAKCIECADLKAERDNFRSYLSAENHGEICQFKIERDRLREENLVLRDALNGIEAMDICSTQPDFIWLVNWRNNVKRDARLALAKADSIRSASGVG